MLGPLGRGRHPVLFWIALDTFARQGTGDERRGEYTMQVRDLAEAVNTKLDDIVLAARQAVAAAEAALE